MANCQGCGGALTSENSAPSVVIRNRGMCNPCSRVRLAGCRISKPKSFILYRSRANAKLRGIENTLVIEDIPDIPARCPVFPWIKLEYRVGEGLSDGSPALDRIDNSKGYVRGNVRIVSNRANELKSDSTDQELLALGKDAANRS